MDFSNAPPIVRAFVDITEVHAVELLLFHRHCYYIRGAAFLTDYDYDCLEWFLRWKFPHNATLHTVGSSRWEDYPTYVRAGRRPFADERAYYHPLLLRRR
jgi:hypothetical protein